MHKLVVNTLSLLCIIIRKKFIYFFVCLLEKYTKRVYNYFMRKKIISPETIMLSTIHIVAKDGLENLSTRKVAAESGISDGCMFNYFKSKTDLLIQCLYFIDRQIDAELSTVHFNMLSPKKSIRELWFNYFNFLISHGDYARFYRQFRHSSYYNAEVVEGQNKSFSFFVKLIKNVSPLFNINMDIFWVYIIETTLDFAVRVADKQLPCEESDKEKYFALFANGISGVLKGTNDWK